MSDPRHKLTLRIDEPMRKAMNMACAEADTKLQQYVVGLIEKDLKKRCVVYRKERRYVGGIAKGDN